jgi:ornithine--oxo-acid transaminase
LATQHFINLETQYGANNYAPLDVVITIGQGIWVEDVDGNLYMDCLSAYSAVNQGHCHPRIVETLIEQAQKLQLTSRAFRNDQLGPFYEQICQLTGYEMV